MNQRMRQFIAPILDRARRLTGEELEAFVSVYLTPDAWDPNYDQHKHGIARSQAGKLFGFNEPGKDELWAAVADVGLEVATPPFYAVYDACLYQLSSGRMRQDFRDLLALAWRSTVGEIPKPGTPERLGSLPAPASSGEILY